METNNLDDWIKHKDKRKILLNDFEDKDLMKVI